jgi:hypothetical protein
LPFHGQAPSLALAKSGVLLCAYRDMAPDRQCGVGLAYSYDEGVTWAEGEPLYLSDNGLWDCACQCLFEDQPGEFVVFYYTAGLGTRTHSNIPDNPAYHSIYYTDPDNAIEMARFRQVG